MSLDDATLDIDITTGNVTPSALPARSPLAVAGGRMAMTGDPDLSISPRVGPGMGADAWIVDAASGDVLLREKTAGRVLHLSPDGQFAIGLPYQVCDGDETTCVWSKPTATVYDLASGHAMPFQLGESTLGWSPANSLLRAQDGAVDVCSPVEDVCTSVKLKVDPDGLVVGDTRFEG